MAHKTAITHRFAEAIFGGKIPRQGEVVMTPKRMEEICGILVARVEAGQGLGSNPGVHRGRHLGGPIMAKMRTMSLSKETGVSVEELEEFRRTAPEEMKERIIAAKKQ